MEYDVLRVVNLYRHHIVYRNASKRNKIQLFVIGLVFALLSLTSFTIGLADSSYSNVVQTTMNYFNPVNPLYNEIGKIVFAGGNSVIYNAEKNVTLSVPILSSNTSVNTDSIEFEIKDSIMVMSSGDGIIEEVGTLANGQKYISIKHSKSITTRYENIEIAGVVPGEIVKSGQDIATAKIGEYVKFVILQNDATVNGLQIKNNRVEWEK